jgi:GNAT superfamily N-acetyltransferase
VRSAENTESGTAVNLALRTEYWHDANSRAAFKRFILQIHGLDFSEWESRGYWDDAYAPFSFFKGDTLVASACIYLLDAVIDRKAVRLAQISGVGTLPEWRRKGLNRKLTAIALDWAHGKHCGIFLFSNKDAIPFYRSGGFEQLDEYVEIAEATPVPARGGAVRLDPENKHDLDRIYSYAKRRTPVSDRFSVLNAKLIMFHVLYLLRNHVYEIPDLECLVFYKRTKGCLSILDILGERIPLMRELYPYIADANDRIIEFHFFTDKLGLDKTKARPLLGNHPFTKGTFPVQKPIFPFTSRA